MCALMHLTSTFLSYNLYGIDFDCSQVFFQISVIIYIVSFSKFFNLVENATPHSRQIAHYKLKMAEFWIWFRDSVFFRKILFSMHFETL